MKRLVFLIAGFLVVFGMSGCSADSNVIVLQDDLSNLNQNNDYSYIGMLDSKIKVSVMFSTYENKVAKGEIIFLKSKLNHSIPIVGTIKNGIINFSEFNKNGEITGMLHGKYDNENFTGKWMSLKTMHDISLKLKSNSNGKKYDFKIDNKSAIYGTYQYSLSNNGSGILEIKHRDKSIDFLISTISSSLSTAEVQDCVSELDEHNKFIYGEQISKDCLFGVEFYNSFARVHYIDDKNDCGFGMNAGVDGIYYKVDKK